MVTDVSLFPLVSMVLSAMLMAVAIVVPARRSRAVRFFILLNAGTTLYSLGYFLRLNVSPHLDPALAPPLSPAYWCMTLSVIGASASATYLFLFGAEVAGLDRWTRGWWFLAAQAHIAFTVVAGMTNWSHHLFISLHGEVSVYGPLARIHHVSGFLLGAAGFLLLVRAVWMQPHGYRKDAFAFGLSSLVPFAGGIIWVSRDLTHIPAEAFAAPALQPIGNIVLAFLVFRAGLADIIPVGTLRSVMENTDALLAYLGPRLRFVTANSPFLEGAGLTEKQLIGRHISEVIADTELLEAVERAVQAKERVEQRGRRDLLGGDTRGGSTYWNWNLKPVMAKDRVRGFVLSLTDVTREVQEAEFSSALGDLVRKLHSTLQPESALPSIVASAGALLDARLSSLILPDGEAWRWIADCSQPQPQWDEFDPSDSPHVRLALETRRPVVVSDLKSEPMFARSAEVWRDMHRTLAIPLVKGDVIAIICFASDKPGDWTAPEVAFVRELSSELMVSLGNAELYATERRIADTLQDAMLRLPESVEGLQMAHAYRAAVDVARVGGDFYDVFEMEGCLAAVVVGDVSGKGLDAAVLTSLVKNTVRGLAIERGQNPSEVVRLTNQAVFRESRQEEFITLFFGILDRQDGRFVYCNGGHTPAVIMGADGSITTLKPNSPFVGAFSNVRFHDSEARLEEGDVLFLYTDGLTEARNRCEQFGEDRLLDVLADVRGEQPAHVVQRVLDEVNGFALGRLRDDLAILAVKCLGAVEPREAETEPEAS